MQKYPIMFDGQKVGMAAVERQGMYYLVRCSCQSRAVLERTVFLADMKLGRCVPENGAYTLTKRVVCRDMPKEPEFILMPDPEEKRSILREDQPVQGIEKLPSAKFDVLNGMPVLIFSDQISSSSTTGQ